MGRGRQMGGGTETEGDRVRQGGWRRGGRERDGRERNRKGEKQGEGDREGGSETERQRKSLKF